MYDTYADGDKGKETNETKGETIQQGRGLQFQIEWSEKE